MKSTIFFTVILGCAILITGCKEGEINKKPEYSADDSPPTRVPTEINMKAIINLAAVQQAVEAELPNAAIQFPRTHEHRCVNVKFLVGSKWVGCDYWGGVEKRGPFSLTGGGDTLLASLPIHLWASGKLLAVQESTDANITALISAKPKLTEDWQLRINPEASFRWDSHPEIKLFGVFSIGIQDALTGRVNDLMRSQVSKVAAKIEGTQLREGIASLWNASFNPIQISKDQNIWLRMGMQKANFSGIGISNNIMSASVEVSATTEVFKGIEPSPLQAIPLPSLGSAPNTTPSFNLFLPVTLSYSSMGESVAGALKKGEKWAPISTQPSVFVTITDAKVYPSEGKIVVQIDFSADLPHKLFDTSGTVFLSGKPMVNNEKKEFSVDGLGFTAATDNRLVDLITNILNPAITNRISSALRINYQPQYDKLLSEANERINHDFGGGTTSKGSFSSAEFGRLILTKESAEIQIKASGKLELLYGL